MCILNNCLEWDKWVLNERTYPTPDMQLFNTLIPPVAGGLSLAYTVLHCAGLVTPECTRGVIDHSTPDTTVEIGSTSATVE